MYTEKQVKQILRKCLQWPILDTIGSYTSGDQSQSEKTKCVLYLKATGKEKQTITYTLVCL